MELSREHTENIVEEYIRSRFNVQPDDSLFARDINLWEGGYIDSVGVVELIVFLEGEFRVKLPEEVFFDPDFTSIQGMARILMRHGAGFPASVA
jgi:acyl carrier protein